MRMKNTFQLNQHSSICVCLAQHNTTDEPYRERVGERKRKRKEDEEIYVAYVTWVTSSVSIECDVVAFFSFFHYYFFLFFRLCCSITGELSLSRERANTLAYHGGHCLHAAGRKKEMARKKERKMYRKKAHTKWSRWMERKISKRNVKKTTKHNAQHLSMLVCMEKQEQEEEEEKPATRHCCCCRCRRPTIDFFVPDFDLHKTMTRQNLTIGSFVIELPLICITIFLMIPQWIIQSN